MKNINRLSLRNYEEVVLKSYFQRVLASKDTQQRETDIRGVELLVAS